MIEKRKFWLFERIKKCLAEIDKLPMKSDEDYKVYCKEAKELAQEIIYCVTEWDKCYND